MSNKVTGIILIIITSFLFQKTVFAEEKVYQFSYTGNAQEFIVPESGYYQIEAWGANGGKNLVENGYGSSNVRLGGTGAYTSGTIFLKAGEKLYIYIGGKGENGKNASIAAGGYNGGGQGDHDHNDNEASAGGGGATDIRLVGGNWDSFESLKSRIMVAAGGGGASYDAAGGYGGSLVGGATTYSEGGTQTSGYAFGKGMDGINVDSNVDVAGGGGGYYGGYANSSGAASIYLASGAGGSSFVSGCDGCNAISETSTEDNIIHINQATHYSGLKFTDINMLDGNKVSDKPSEDGFAKITFIKSGTILTDVTLEKAEIKPKSEHNYYEYIVYLEKDAKVGDFNLVFNQEPLNVIGDKSVSLEIGTKHNITVTSQDGEITIYTFEFLSQFSHLKDLQFDYLKLDFSPDKFEYHATVSYNIKKLIPLIKKDEDTTYEIEGNDNLEVGDNVILINVTKEGYEQQTYTIHVTRENYEEIEQNFNQDFIYTGDVQKFTVPVSGFYKLEAWGASGGKNMADNTYSSGYTKIGGAGAYTSGTIYLESGTTLYIYVGGKGEDGKKGQIVAGGYNGGGTGDHDHGDDEAAAGGGGATDIRLVGGKWNDFESLKSRIMVAAGGGGAAYEAAGGYGGTLTGESTTYSEGGTQTTGYAFGKGMDGVYVDSNVDVAGGGSGYYGGYANSSGVSSQFKTSGAGGSSFVSGCIGCNAIASSSTENSIVHTGTNAHYSGYVFTDITMLAGNESMPSYNSEEEMTGNAENGYARITLIKSAPELKDLTIEGGIINEPLESGHYIYHVEIPNDLFETNINAIPQDKGTIVLGDGKVTLNTTDTHYITLMDETGQITIYSIISNLETVYLDEIAFKEIEFEYIPGIYEYNLEVSNSIRKLTPVITTQEGINYEIEGDLNLKVGNNTFKVVGKNANDIKVEYIFHVTREFADISIKEFDYTGNYQTFTVSKSGYYKIEAWGAGGGKNLGDGSYSSHYARTPGYGAYTSGTVYLEEGTVLYIYVGGKGTDAKVSTVVAGGYNGGGTGDYDHEDNEASGAGGGATDIRLVKGAWNNFESLKSRIMVAAGGGGASYEAVGGYGGTLIGGSTPYSAGGTQTTGYAFGKGMDGVFVDSNVDVAGGGGGYYGGYANSSGKANIYKAAGAGGSSFVSGCVGCDAISEDSTESNIIHTSQANHYSGYVFSDIEMIAGNAVMPTHDGTDTMTGNVENGYAKITYISDIEETKLTSLTVSKGTMDPVFNSDIYEYTVELDPLDTKVVIDAESNNPDALVEGIGEITVNSGEIDHYVTVTKENGEVITYKIHFIRDINSYDRLDDILINGLSISNFSPDVYEYDIEVSYLLDFVNISAIKNNEFQNVTNDGIYIFDSDNLSVGIVVVSEDGTHDKVYTLNIHREKTSLLKGINVHTPGVESINFNRESFQYDLELNNSILQLDLTANPYYKGAVVTIEGSQFVEDQIKITSHVDGVEDSVYILNVKRTDKANYEIDYTLTGKTETFIAPYSGYYRVSLWGAAGGQGMTNGKLVYNGGEGAYTAGTINLKQGEELYINVGGKGNNAGTGSNKFAGSTGGYNGGGTGGPDGNQDSNPEPGSGGGGATDIRILNGVWNSESSLRSRLMVAAGASGGGYSNVGVAGGGTNGYTASQSSRYATQIAGYAPGIGANGGSSSCGASGAGGGYYGGYTTGSACYSSGGGSSYISGHIGSIGTKEDGTPNTTTYTTVEDSYNYSGKYFTDTIMIDGNGYLWTDTKKQLELMPNPDGGYFASGHGNPKDGAANITLLQALSNNNFLDSLTLHIGDKEIPLNPHFEVWTTEYNVELAEDEAILTVDAKAKDENAVITGLGDYKVPPKDSVVTVSVTSTDGSVRNYEIHVYREPSNDPTPNNIAIKGMHSYICSINSEYCKYMFDPQIEDYDITVPYSISNLELIPDLKTNYQQVVYYKYIDGNYEVVENLDEEGNPNNSLNVTLSSGLNQFIIEVIAENEEDSTLYYYNITRDPTGNTNVQNIEITKPDIEFPFAPLTYEYYITLGEEYEDDEVLFNVVPELDTADVEIRGNTNLSKGMNDCYIVITAPNGETKTYVFHIYKETNSSVYLKKLEVKNGEETYSLSPLFDKTINDYLVNVTNSDQLEIIAEAENSSAQVSIDKPDEFTSGITQVTITVKNGEAENIYYINVVRLKNENANLANLEILEYNGTEKYEFQPEFNSNVLDYYMTIPKSVRKVTVKATPEEETTTCKVKGHTALINNTGTITITCTAEDNTEKQYHVYVTKDVSDNNKLKDINISTGDDIGLLTPEFNPDTHNYEVTVGENVERIFVQGVLADSSASIKGNGYYSLEKGDNTIELIVTSELGTEATYTIVVHKELSDDVSIKEILNDQNSEVSVISDSSLNYDYLINVQYEVKKINIEAIPNNSNATVSGNGSYNLNVGENEILITVTSESGKIENYIVKVIRDLSHNDDLSYLFAEEGALTPRFNSTTVYYEVYVANDVTKLTLDVETEDENATYDIEGNENFAIGSNQVKIIVTAQSGNKKEYVLNVIRQEATIDPLALKSLTVNEGILDPTFDSNNDIYYVTVPNEITNITIEGKALSSDDIVSGNGTYSLQVGKNALAITVSNLEGIRRDYQVVVTREKSDDATLSSFVISGHTFTPTFNKEITEYSINTSSNSLEFTTIKPTEEEATYEIIGNENLTTGSIVTIRVTSPSGKVTKDYNLNITRNPSNNNNLSSLEVVGETLIPTFHKGIQVYTLTVGNEINSILVNATPEDQNAKVTGTGLYNLNVGLNEISVMVTSEAGTQKNYTIIITREGNDNNYLQDLLVGEEELTPNFQKDVYEYEVTVPYETEEIEIYGEAEVSTSIVNGNGSYNLDVGINTIRVEVTSELGNTREYEIRITREELNSVELQSLNIKGYELNMEFDSDYYEYYINVPNEIQSLNLSDIIATPIDPTAIVTIEGYNPEGGFKIGMNDITITVTSTKTENLSQEYHLFVNRQLSGNNELISLTVSEGNLEPIFSPNVMSYQVNVDYSITEIEVDAIAQDGATIISGVGKHSLLVGENKIIVKVRSMLGVERNYIIYVNRAASTNNNLSKLQVLNNFDNLDLTPTFSPDELNYILEVDSSIQYVNITATPEDSRATVSGTGIKELKENRNEYQIIVTSESKETKIYTITIIRTKSSNNNVIQITPSVGSFTEEFNPEIEEYTLNVSENDLFLSFDVVLEDKLASVHGHESAVIPNGTSTRTIEITAEDGSTRNYIINVVKENISEARLESLSIEGYEIEFDPNTFSYNLQVSASKEKLLESEITAVAKDPEATVNLMGDFDLSEGIINIYVIEVIAKDGYTTQEYRLNITRDSLEYTLNTDVYDIVRTEEDYVIGINQATDLQTFKGNFKNELEMLHVYDSEGLIEITEPTSYAGTGLILRLEKNGYIYDEVRVIVRADLTGDGKINVTDQVKLINYQSKIVTLSDYEMLAADLTRDGIVNVLDQVRIINYIGRILTDSDLNP